MTHFNGCGEYSPELNPLEGLTTEEINEFCFEYMAMWLDQEGFSDFNIMYEAVDQGMCADWLVSAGAIDSEACYEHCQGVERIIEGWAKEFRNKSDEARMEAYNEVFKDCTILTCNECGDTQFFNDGNELIYADQLGECWACSSSNVTVKKWEK